jgi:hypothetical protein
VPKLGVGKGKGGVSTRSITSYILTAYICVVNICGVNYFTSGEKMRSFVPIAVLSAASYDKGREAMLGAARFPCF